MKAQTRKRTIHLGMVVPLGTALVAFCAAGLALAGPSKTPVPATGYRLTAQLTAGQETQAGTGSTSAQGRFDGVLVRTGTGQAARVGPLPAGCKFVPPARSGLPTRVVCDNGRLTLPLPKVAGKWSLAWRLTFSGLTGHATAAHIHSGAKGHAGAVVDPLCGPCTSGATGVTSVTAAQAAVLLHGGEYVNVHTTKNPNGEIRGQIERVTSR